MVALDLGSSSVRATLYDESAEAVGEDAQRSYDSSGGTLDPDELVEAAQG